MLSHHGCGMHHVTHTHTTSTHNAPPTAPARAVPNATRAIARRRRRRHHSPRRQRCHWFQRHCITHTSRLILTHTHTRTRTSSCQVTLAARLCARQSTSLMTRQWTTFAASTTPTTAHAGTYQSRHERRDALGKQLLAERGAVTRDERDRLGGCLCACVIAQDTRKRDTHVCTAPFAARRARHWRSQAAALSTPRQSPTYYAHHIYITRTYIHTRTCLRLTLMVPMH
jgi:hypothetical protein